MIRRESCPREPWRSLLMLTSESYDIHEAMKRDSYRSRRRAVFCLFLVLSIATAAAAPLERPSTTCWALHAWFACTRMALRRSSTLHSRELPKSMRE